MESGTGLSTLQGTSIHSPVSELDVELGAMGDLPPPRGGLHPPRPVCEACWDMGNTQMKGEPEGATMSGSSSESEGHPGPSP